MGYDRSRDPQLFEDPPEEDEAEEDDYEVVHLEATRDEDEYTLEDFEADRADRILAERKEMDPAEWSEGPYVPARRQGP
jgi:hypothetical protein